MLPQVYNLYNVEEEGDKWLDAKYMEGKRDGLFQGTILAVAGRN